MMNSGRKRKGYLAIVLSMMMVLSLFPGCTNSGTKEETKEAETDRITEILNQMTLEEKIGQMMIPSFRIWTDLRVELPEGDIRTKYQSLRESLVILGKYEGERLRK